MVTNISGRVQLVAGIPSQEVLNILDEDHSDVIK